MTLHPAGWPRPLRAALVGAAALVLVLHASALNAVCDDAFITLRYARNLVLYGAPVYNLGERVEGYTSPLWMLLSAGPLAIGIEGRMAAALMGAASGAALVAAVWHLWNRVAPSRPLAGVVVLGLVAISTPIAVWTSSGLETSFFAALVCLSVAEVSACIDEPSRERALCAGVVVALTTLTRHEGALIGAVSLVWLAARRTGRPAAPWFVLAAGLPVALFLVWRLSYYGALLPNTFFAKLSATTKERIDGGLRYTAFAGRDMGGVASIVVLAFALAAPSRSTANLVARVVIALYIAFVIFVGGDFLDLFRFFVPVLPLLYVVVVGSALELGARWGATSRQWAVIALLTLPLYVMNQVKLHSRALQVERDPSAEMGLWIERIGWTKRHAQLWGDMGRFLGAHAMPGDTMASGAAGAMAFYAELPNLDLLGLTDAEVARHGMRVGVRPGHQMYARLDYVLARRPTYLMVQGCAVSWPGWNWEEAGYVCVEARTPSSTGGEIQFSFLVDGSRAETLVRERVVAVRAKR